jgi:hypothetical protein
LSTVEVGVRSRNPPAVRCAETPIVQGDFPIQMNLKALDRLVEIVGNLAEICSGFGGVGPLVHLGFGERPHCKQGQRKQNRFHRNLSSRPTDPAACALHLSSRPTDPAACALRERPQKQFATLLLVNSIEHGSL